MNKILLIVNPNLKDKDNALSAVYNCLNNYEVIVFDKALDKKEAYYKLDLLLNDVDTVITLGGDGSMLKVAEPVYKHGVNLLGINYGGIGYLTSLRKDELDKLSFDTKIEKRTMLEVRALDDVHYALNDVVVCKSNINIPIKLKVDDGTSINSYFADGLIISTPTGSSAYSYSAGAPIIEEGKIVLTPICPVNRSSHYKIYNDDISFKLNSFRDNRDSAFLSIDGSNSIGVNKDDYIYVKKAPNKLKIVRF